MFKDLNYPSFLSTIHRLSYLFLDQTACQEQQPTEEIGRARQVLWMRTHRRKYSTPLIINRKEEGVHWSQHSILQHNMKTSSSVVFIMDNGHYVNESPALPLYKDALTISLQKHIDRPSVSDCISMFIVKKEGLDGQICSPYRRKVINYPQ